MSEDTLDLDVLDASDAELKAEPASEPAPEAPAEAQPRDPATGQFVAQPPAAPAPEATPSAATPPAATQESNASRVIPLAAHMQERNQWRQEIAERDRKLGEIQARLAALEPKAPAPDFVEDPKGYVDGVAKQAQEEIKALRAEAEKLQGEQQFARFTQDLGAQQAVFVDKTPDYYDALNHVRGIRSQQLTLMYPTASPEQIQQAIAQEELQAAWQFMNQGRNPAELAYELAKSLGYKKAAAPAAPVAPAPPAIPRAPVADPSNTLGSSAPPSEEDEAGGDDDPDGLAVVNAALAERFGTRG